MPLPKKVYPVAIAVVSLFVAAVSIVAVSAGRIRSSDKPALGIEIALEKPFYIPAATTSKEVSAVVMVPPAEDSSNPDRISAIKLVPRMEDGKVKVTIFALSGDTKNIKSCSDWNLLKSTKIDTYTAGLNEEVSISKLRDFGVSFGNGPLKFRVVPKKVVPQYGGLGDGNGCGCGSCGGLQCCPNPGFCIGCGICGQVCCSGGG